MRSAILLSALAAALLHPPPALETCAACAQVAQAAQTDLARVERTISKEPAYRTKSPKYCLLVFGPEARSRVWLVQDGDELYVDRNGNGDLTEKDERVTTKSDKDAAYRQWEVGEVRVGGLTHQNLVVTQMRVEEGYVGNAKEFARIKAGGREPWVWTVGVAAERSADDARKLPKRIRYIVNGDGLGLLLFADRPQDAPIIHLNGPWTLGLQDWKSPLVAGQKTMLQIGVGTQGVGPGTFSFVLYPDTIPADAYPVADITFPPPSPDGKPHTQKFTLTERC